MHKVKSEISKVLESIALERIPMPVPSVYDTAWVALVEESGRPLFPECVDWILANQNLDGGFGAPSQVYIFDSMLSTAAAILVLHKHNQQHMLKMAVEFIQANLTTLAEATYEQSVGFEVLFIKLLDTITELGYKLDLSHPVIKRYRLMREEKLKALPRQYIFSTTTSLLHSLEGIGKLSQSEYESILALQSSNGSMLNSPSATAFLYMRTGQPRLLKYLIKVIDKTGGYMPVNFPLDNFSGLWVINMLEKVGVSDIFREQIMRVLNNIYPYWDDSRGISWSKEIDLPDLDDTAVAFRLLKKYGFAVSPDALKVFFSDGKLRCFRGEIHGGVSHNANLLITLASITNQDETLKSMQKAAQDFILKNQHKQGYWSDKWHLSNIYATTNAVSAIRSVSFDSAKRGLKWLVNNRKSGRWGTIEEDGYALICLSENIDLIGQELYDQILRDYRSVSPDIEGGMSLHHKSNMWIDKVLYADLHITHTLRYLIRYLCVQ